MNLNDFQKNVSLAEKTTFKVGGLAEYFFEARNKEDIIKAIKAAKENNLPFFILGEGSNVLAQDQGFEGLIIKIHNTGYKILDTKIAAGAGAMLKDLVEAATKSSLSGLEWAAGIPGILGGSVYGNAQAFEGNMAGLVKEVEALDTQDLTVKIFDKEQCRFSEKNSIFKENKNLVILGVVLELKKGKKLEIQKLIKEHLALRKNRHPLDYPSAGSVFVNKAGQLPSSMLIEKAGLKGKQVGKAQVSEKHAGFIVNLGGATAQDILDLVAIIKKEVKDKLGIELKEEIQIIK